MAELTDRQNFSCECDYCSNDESPLCPRNKAPTATTEGCETCGGKKYVPDSDFDGEPTPCPDCGGTGESDNG